MGDAELRALADRSLVAKIRLICAREFNLDPSYDFFYLNYNEGESADAALLRLFQEEHEDQRSRGYAPTFRDVILTLCHG